ncbi:Uncharacterized protein GBIM_00226 [Gryllus bimaculatus]|nr:Uncharacterized protein GBIM_00226 [Gryllus bimaculatus]
MWPNQTNSSSGGGGGGAGGALVFEPMALSAAEGGGRAGRLLLVAGLAVVGSVGNIFMISSIITEDHLRKRGREGFNAAAVRIVVREEWAVTLIRRRRI